MAYSEKTTEKLTSSAPRIMYSRYYIMPHFCLFFQITTSLYTVNKSHFLPIDVRI